MDAPGDIPHMKLSEIAEALDAPFSGDGSIEIARAVHPAEAESATDLALAMDKEMLELLGDSPARAAVVFDGAGVPADALDGYIVVGRPRYAMAGLMELFEKPVDAPDGIHPAAVISEGASLAPSAVVGALAYVGPGAEIGENTIVMPQATVGAEARIGADCLLHPGARIGERVVLGDRVIVHHNASLGADGFSFVTPEVGSVETAKAKGKVEATNVEIVRINSIGTVEIGDDVEIGACTSLDRGTVSATRVGRGPKIDDLVMIGHNVLIGENCLVCGQVGIGGSSKIGDRVVLAGKVGVADHIEVGDDVVVGAGSGVVTDLASKAVYVGSPAIPKQDLVRQVINIRRLDSMISDLRQLKKAVKAVESSTKTS